MKELARIFDLPLDSPEHHSLAEETWIAGPGVGLRYWLGRLDKHNYFRDTNEVVCEGLQRYLLRQGWTQASPLADNESCWGDVSHVLEYHVKRKFASTAARHRGLAIEAFLMNPDATNTEIAIAAGTTEKQIARVPELTWLRRLLKEAIAERPLGAAKI